MVTEYLIAVVWGILITLFLEIIGVLIWFHALQESSQPRSTAIRQATTPQSTHQGRPVVGGRIPSPSSDRLNDSPQRGTERDSPQRGTERDPPSESCDWLNIIVKFVFQELRDSPQLKKLMMKQINKEFTELLLTKSQGKMLERLSVREYDMGTELPSLSNITLTKMEKDLDNDVPTIIEFELDVEYNGGFELSIDADLVFKKVAFVSVQVNKVKGHGRIQFSSIPFTHWSFSFMSTPQLEISVRSQFEGRELSQLSAFLRLQFIRWVKRVHTMPNYKVRFKPFFMKIKPQDQLTDVHLHDSRITRGELLVRVYDCNRLVLPETAVELYCTVSVGDIPVDLQIGVWQKMWPCEEITVHKSSPVENLGLKYKLFPLSDDGKKTVIVVTHVLPYSPSHRGGLKEGDLLKKIDNNILTSINQADKLIKNTKSLKLLLTVRRPSVNILRELQEKAAELEKSSKKKTSKHTRSKSPVNVRKVKGSTPVPPPPRMLEESEEVLLHGDNEDDNEQDKVNEIHLHDEGRGRYDEGRGRYDEGRDRYDEGRGWYDEGRGRYDEGRGRFDQDWCDVSSLDGNSIGSSSTVRKRSYAKDQSFSTPPFQPMETNGHRTLGSSLEPPELINQGRDHTPSPIEPGASADKIFDDVSVNDYGIEPLESCTTKTVSVSRNPKWDEELKLLITSENHYLNICVWCRLQGSEHKSFMIGSVTISLTDLALECAASGVHKQRYVLLPGRDMQTSRKGLKAMTDLPSNAKVGVANTVPKYVGDIYLSFVHEPMEVPPGMPDVSMKERNESLSNTPGVEPCFRNHPFTGEEGSEPDKHDFQLLELKGLKQQLSQCLVCQKKMRKKCMKCERCGALVHEKCIGYCKRMLKCKLERDDPNIWIELDSRGEQVGNYTVAKQMIQEPEKTLTEEEMLLSSEQDTLQDDRVSLEESQLTPPNFSDSEDEVDRSPKHITTHHEETTDFYDMIYTQDELESRIIEAQKQLETLEDNKRLLMEAEDSIDYDKYDYKRQKLEAQKETTLIKLNEYKEKLRQLP